MLPLITTNGTVSDYLKKYSALANVEHGHKLLDIDFAELYPTAVSNIFSAWDSFFDKLSKSQKKKNKLRVRKTSTHARRGRQLM